MADIKRLHYFTHQFLVESDFTDEQQYHLAMRRRHNAALHDYGVADGLAVTRSGDREITIQPGMAIDRDGHELVLLDSRGVSLSNTAAFPGGATVHLTIAWHEEESDPSTATGVTGNTRITETPQVLASTTAPAGDGSVIRLARFTLTGGGNVPGNLGDVFADGRQLAGAALAPASVATDKLADGAVDENKLSASARGKLVTHGDGHDHSGGDGAQIRHSALTLDGGSNPHGTTAADVGALPSTGGAINGSLLVHDGNVGLGTTPQALSRLSLRSDDGPAGIALATFGTTSSDGSGSVTGVDVNAHGTGPGWKRGIAVSTSGAGPKATASFSANSPATSTDPAEYMRAIVAFAEHDGSGTARCLDLTAGGSGPGAKEGLASVVTGAGYKQAGQFWAYSQAGSSDSTNGVYVLANSEGTGNGCGLRVTAHGSGAGFKEGLISTVYGLGPKRAAYFNAESPAESSDPAEGVAITASSVGTGNVNGFWVQSFGSGPGQKEGIVCTVEGSGNKYGGQFRAYSRDAGTAEVTEGLRAVASSEGTGETIAFRTTAGGGGTGPKYGVFAHAEGSGRKTAGVFRAIGDSASADGAYGAWAEVVHNGPGDPIAIVASAGGAGTGQKNALSAHTYGSGRKLAGAFRADSDAGSTDNTLALEAHARSEGAGSVSGIRAFATGEGTGFKEALSCSATGAGPKRAAYFSAESLAGSGDTTEGLYVAASCVGPGNVSSLVVQGSGAGEGPKAGVVCTVSGKGRKTAGSFVAYSTADSTDYVQGLTVTASSPGDDGVYGMAVTSEGSGGGKKVGFTSTVSGGNSWKQAGQFHAASPATQSDYTNGLNVVANSDGTGLTQALTAYVGGSGTGTKYAIYARADGVGIKYAGYFDGNVHVAGMLSKASGTFLIDHPLDPENKTLRHSFVESPEDLCLYRGKVQLDAAGKGSVKMPSYFAALTREEDATVSLTAIGSKPFLTGYEWNRNFSAFTVYGEPGREVSYLVLADRDDPVIHQLRRPVEEKKGAGYFQKGELLNPEAYGKAPKAAPDGVGAPRQTTVPMDRAASAFPDLPAPPTPTAPPDFPSSPLPTAPFPALEEEHRRIEEAWARSREEQRQRMESFQHEEQQRRRQLEEALAARRQQPDQTPQERGGAIETVDEAPETPSAPPESAPPRRKKTVADRKKK